MNRENKGKRGWREGSRVEGGGKGGAVKENMRREGGWGRERGERERD